MNSSEVFDNYTISYLFDCKHRRPDSDVERISKQTVYVLLVVLGIMFNIFVIVLGAKFPVRKNLHHLIINMVVADALFLFSHLMFYIPWWSDRKWTIYPSGTLGIALCKSLMFVLNTSFRVSLMNLLVISIERFRATRALQRSRPYTRKQLVAVLGVTWLIPMAGAISEAYAAKIYSYGCYGQCEVRKDVLETNLAISFYSLIGDGITIIACSVIFVLSIVTIRRLSKPQAIHAHLNKEQQRTRARRNRAAVRMVIASVILYTCCLVPWFVWIVFAKINIIIPSANIIDLSPCIDWRSLYFILTVILPLVNSCLSPCIYIIFLNDFRLAAKKVFCRRENEPVRDNAIEMRPLNREG